MSDTIFALATPPGRAALAVVRCSGPESSLILQAIAGPLPLPRRASLRRLRERPGGEVFDEALILWFAGPASFTGEDAFELHLHGGSATVAAATHALSNLGARFAEPGEFSKRAFQAGKLSLVQAEAIADLVDAESDAQRRQALDQLGGALDTIHSEWRAKLIEVAALLEAQVDFPDEDLPETLATAGAAIQSLAEDMQMRELSRRGEQVREGFRIALIGAPNAGKSSLLNAMLGRDAAIVTSVPGTTRDVIEAPLMIAGYKVLIADTAGLRSTDDVIEAEGVRRARAWADAADLRLLLLDGSARRSDDHELATALKEGDLVLVSKSDLPIAEGPGEQSLAPSTQTLSVSVVDGTGLESLRGRLEALIVGRLSGSDFPAVTRARHRDQLNAATEALAAAVEGLMLGPELAAEDVRRASQALRAIVGEVGVDDVLGGVFDTFCIGK